MQERAPTEKQKRDENRLYTMQHHFWRILHTPSTQRQPPFKYLSLSLCPTLTLSSCFCYPLSLSLSPCFSPVRFVEFKMLRFSHSATGENNTLPKKQTHIQRDVTLAPHNEQAINSSFYFFNCWPSLSLSFSLCISVC